jgi:hypothetical protein
MFDLTPSHRGSSLRSQGEEWVRRHAPARQLRPADAVSPAVIAGLVLVGLGILTWHYMGPDLVRYMKIRSM